MKVTTPVRGQGDEAVGKAGQEIQTEYRQLQEQLLAHHDEVSRHEAGDEDFGTEYAQLLQAADALLAYEKTIPAKLAEPERQASERIVRISWLGQSAVAVALVVVTFVLDHSAWWLVVLVPHLIATLIFSSQKVTDKDHLFYRRLTIGLHVECVLIILITLSVISLWFVILAVIGWLLLGSFASNGPGDPAKKGQRQ
ncbi:hypothetical protein ACIPJS_38065 [Streptomyces sp. NPDC086783]|uniref:hypothetical protein n=1 Tax=Streptomyces sp. NPDC086783 TaxID=3365758 RepID=UPI003802E176